MLTKLLWNLKKFAGWKGADYQQAGMEAEYDL